MPMTCTMVLFGFFILSIMRLLFCVPCVPYPSFTYNVLFNFITFFIIYHSSFIYHALFIITFHLLSTFLLLCFIHHNYLFILQFSFIRYCLFFLFIVSLSDTYAFIHSFIHSFRPFYSASSSPLLPRGAPDTIRILCEISR